MNSRVKYSVIIASATYWKFKNDNRGMYRVGKSIKKTVKAKTLMGWNSKISHKTMIFVYGIDS